MANSDEKNLSVNQGKRRIVIRFLSWTSLSVILILHFLYLLNHFAPAIVAPDANGYWAQGSLLFTTGRTWFKPSSDAQYIGIHWLVTESGRYFSRYPPGLPVLIGLVYKLFGFKASVLVNPVLATLSLLGLYFLIRRLLEPGWCVAGVLVLAVLPVFNGHALACDSHIAVTFCLIWGLYLLLRWSEQGKLWEAFLAGMLLGCIPTIRYPEALFALGVGVFLLWHVRSHEKIWLHYLAMILGAALPLVPLLIRNQLAFGAFYRTAYALTNEQTGFGWNYFKLHFVDYIRNLHGEGVGLFFPLGVIGMAVMCCVRRYRRVGVLLLMLTIPSTLLYMSYYWGPQTMSGATMRFLLPTFICYIVAGLWILARAMEGTSSLLKSCSLIALLLLQFVWGGFNSFENTKRLHYQKDVLARITDGLERRIKHGDVVVANRQLLQHLDFVRHWRLVDSMIFGPGMIRDRFMRFMNRRQDPNAPMPMQLEKREIQLEKYSGMPPYEREDRIARDIRKWAGEHRVYYVGSAEELERFRGHCFNSRFFKVIGHVQLPEQPPIRESEGLMGAAMRLPRGGPMRFGRGGIFRQMLARRGGRRFRGMGGPMGQWWFLQLGNEVVIAEWTYRPSN